MKRTDFFVVGLLVVAIGYELWTLANAVPGDTISESVWRAIAQNQIITFLAGVLCGHFFWQRKGHHD